MAPKIQVQNAAHTRPFDDQAVQAFRESLVSTLESHGGAWPKAVAIVGFPVELCLALAPAIEARVLVTTDDVHTPRPARLPPNVTLLHVDKTGVEAALMSYARVAHWLMDNALDPSSMGLVRAKSLSPRLSDALLGIEDLRVGNSCKLLGLNGDGLVLSESMTIQWANHLASSGDYYHAIKLLQPLYNTAQAKQVAPIIVALCVQLGMIGPVLDRWTPLLSTSDQSALRANLPMAAPEGRDELQKRLLKNLCAFGYDENSPEAGALLAAIPPDLHVAHVPNKPIVYTFGQGYQPQTCPILFRYRNGLIEEVSPLLDPYDLLQQAKTGYEVGYPSYHSFFLQDPHVQLLLNLAANVPIFWSAPGRKFRIYLVAPEPEKLAGILAHVDLTHLMKGYGILLYVGADATKRCLEGILREPFGPVPSTTFGLDGASASCLAEFTENYPRRRSALLERLQSKYNPARTLEALQALRGDLDRPARVAFLTTRFSDVTQYVCGDMAEALRALGVESQVWKETRSDQAYTHNTIPLEVDKFDPDLLLVIDHIRPEYGDSVPKGLPFVCWIQDELTSLVNRSVVEKLGPLDFTYVLWPHWPEYFRKFGYRHLEQLSFAANSNVYNLGTTDQEKDFALYYITNWSDQAPSAGSPELTQAILRRMTPENVLDASDKNHKELLDGACNDLGLKLKSDEYAYALKLIRDQLSRWYDRKQVAESLVATGAPVRLYGRGWREDEGFRPYAQGSVAQGADLAEVYRKAAIVVQVNHAGNAHARVFEAIACGAVVIARSHPSDFQPGGLNAHLEIGKEILTFSNDGELKHIVERLLNDKPYYHSILDAARTRVLRDHTYLARTKQMLGDVTTNLARWAERTQS